MPDASLVLTGTVTNPSTGLVSVVAFAIPFPGIQVAALSFALLIILGLFVWINRFQMWSLLLALIISVVYAPLSLTAYGIYYLYMAFVALVLLQVLHFFSSLSDRFK